MENKPMAASESSWTCTACAAQNSGQARQCASCGRARFGLTAEFGKKSVYSVLAVYLLFLLAIIYIYLAEPGGTGWKGTLTGLGILAAITLFFVLSDWADFRQYIFPSRIRWKLMSGIVLMTPLFSFAVSNGTAWLNRTVSGVRAPGLERYADVAYPFWFAFLVSAVLSPLIEEAAFRGVTFSRARGIFSLRQCIWISAILFTFLHLVYLSFVWILPFALVLGWFRARYRTLFYGLCIHFLHNFTAILLEKFHYDNLF